MFHSEIFAILKVIEPIPDGPASVLEFYMVFDDHQAALRVIAFVWCKSRLVRECKESLRTFGPDRISLCCVPDHSGILGNETGDALARLGSLSEAI